MSRSRLLVLPFENRFNRGRLSASDLHFNTTSAFYLFICTLIIFILFGRPPLPAGHSAQHPVRGVETRQRFAFPWLQDHLCNKQNS